MGGGGNDGNKTTTVMQDNNVQVGLGVPYGRKNNGLHFNYSQKRKYDQQKKRRTIKIEM